MATPTPRGGPGDGQSSRPRAGDSKSAVSRRFSALRSLGQQAHRGEVQRALHASLEALSQHREDVPFGLAFMLDGGGQARLVASYGVETHSPPRTRIAMESVPWLRGRQEHRIAPVEDIPGAIAFGTTAGRQEGYFAPILPAGTPVPFALLVLGVDPDQALDPDYLTFLEVLAERIGRSARLAAEREARSRGIDLLDALPALVSVTRGPEHVYELVNRAYAETIGIGRSALGKPFSEVHPEDQLQGLLPLRDRAFAGETVRIGEAPMAFDGIGTERYFDLLYGPLRGVSGEVEGILSFGIDVTEQVRARKRIESLNAELGEATRFKDELLALLSHELRTPLTIALGSLELLKDHRATLTEEEAENVLEDALQNARRLERLIANMLALSRAELLGAADVEPLLLHRRLPESVEQFARDLRFDVGRIELRTQPTEPVLANAVFLDQIVVNLISNALKYGDPAAKVVVAVEPCEDGATVTVENSGARLNDDELEAIFHPFFRVAGSETQASGLGLGLAVCRRLAEAQGGTITAASRAGGGLRVTLRLRQLPPEERG